ncbi:MAG: hypothetical protein ABT07_05855 [Microbacterium sp. SCN 70-10]|nr:MAG: hypothetical protein ABT07_05855 [Microbacterium sp. SCN 70-10]
MRTQRYSLLLIAGLLGPAAGCGPDADDPAAFKSGMDEAAKAAEKGKELMKRARKKPLNVPKRPVDEPG